MVGQMPSYHDEIGIVLFLVTLLAICTSKCHWVVMRFSGGLGKFGPAPSKVFLQVMRFSGDLQKVLGGFGYGVFANLGQRLSKVLLQVMGFSEDLKQVFWWVFMVLWFYGFTFPQITSTKKK
jgi:hypothetical protein